MNNQAPSKPLYVEVDGFVYCMMCAHTVKARVLASRRSSATAQGQKCPRCSSSLDSAAVLGEPKAA